MNGRFDQDQIDELKSRVALSSIFEKYGYTARMAKGIGWCLCPWHTERTPSCKISDARGQFVCFGCNVAGDHITAMMYLAGLSFIEAVEALGGVREVTPEDRRRIEAQRAQIEREERAEREKAQSAAERLFDQAKPIAGTHAAAYLTARGLTVVPRWTADLRFAARLSYRGFRSPDSDEPEVLGEFPAMIAAIRDAEGAMIGLHRTYLDPERPLKLVAPGDRKRNLAKKIMGSARGGMIRLSPMASSLVIGEGIETSQSWVALGRARPGVAIAAGISIYNVSGRQAGSLPHPSKKGKRIGNGIPDAEEPGIILPDVVRDVTILGDGDSDRATTVASLLAGARRFHDQGRAVSVVMAPDGRDFNDLLVSEAVD